MNSAREVHTTEIREVPRYHGVATRDTGSGPADGGACLARRIYRSRLAEGIERERSRPRLYGVERERRR